MKWIATSIILLIDIFIVYLTYFSTNGPWWTDVATPFIPLYIFLLIPVLFCFFFKRLLIVSLVSTGSIILTLICIGPLWFSVFNSEQKIDNENQFSIMNINASFFYNNRKNYDRYNDPLKSAHSVALIDWLQEQSTDVIAVQEFYDDSVSNVYNVVDQMELKGYKYYRLHGNPRVKSSRRSGMIIFSKWPIVNSEFINISKNRFNGSHFADVVWHNDTIRVINVHLESMQLGYLPKSVKSTSISNKLKWKWQFLKKTFASRKQQLIEIKEFAKKSKLPTLLVGDFNSQSYSNLIRNINGEYSNSYAENGTGLMLTYFDEKIWPVGIDHQFHNQYLSAEYAMIIKELELSNHRPVVGFYTIE